MTKAEKRWGLQKAVHACRRKVAGLEDEAAWRGFLARATATATAPGVDSVRDMTMQQMVLVVEALHAAGAPKARAKLAEAHLRMARGLWIELHRAGVVKHGSDAALDAFVRRTTKVGCLAWCGPDQANKVIEALKDWSKRKGVEVREA
jgi:hypothetical protein